MKTIIALLIATTLISCKEANTKDSLASNNNFAHVMSIEIDGQTHNFKTIDWQRSIVDFDEDKIRIELREVDNPVSLNLHVHDMDILEKLSSDYKLPDANKTSSTIYLDFFDRERKGKVSNRRIQFKNGEIKIKKLSKEKLEMTFNGEGNGMMESGDLFSIKGSVNVNLKTQ